MSVLRNDLQVALNNLHVALMESVDSYRYTAEFVNDEQVGKLFGSVAEERDRLASEVEEAVRESDDFPPVPDTDHETGQQFLQRLEDALSAYQAAEVVDQRL